MGILAREWGSERSIGTHPIGADGEWINRRVDQRSRDGFGGGEGRVGALSFCCRCCFFCFVVERSNTFLFFINLFIILYAYITTNFPLNIKILHTFIIVNLHLCKSYLILIYFIK